MMPMLSIPISAVVRVAMLRMAGNRAVTAQGRWLTAAEVDRNAKAQRRMVEESIVTHATGTWGEVDFTLHSAVPPWRAA